MQHLNLPAKALLACAVAALSLVGASADQHKDKHSDHADKDHQLPTHAVAVLIPTEGNDVRGVVELQQHGKQVVLKGKVINLSPGKHGFHIHEYGDLRAADGKSAGGHYNPDGHDHGAPDDQQHHAGDLGNIEANEQGTATFEIKAKNQKLHLLIGRSIVVHAGADDLKSQPSGDAGPRVALGVIGLAKPVTTRQK